MMNNPISKGSSKDFTQDWISNNETHASTNAVVHRYDIIIQSHQIIGKIPLKVNLRRCITFILAGAIVCSEKVRQ